MKFLNTFVMAVNVLFCFSILLAQKKNDNQNNSDINKNGSALKIDLPQGTGDKVYIKNGAGNSILTIIDEGRDRSSILLPSGANLIEFKDKL